MCVCMYVSVCVCVCVCMYVCVCAFLSLSLSLSLSLHVRSLKRTASLTAGVVGLRGVRISALTPTLSVTDCRARGAGVIARVVRLALSACSPFLGCCTKSTCTPSHSQRHLPVFPHHVSVIVEYAISSTSDIHQSIIIITTITMIMIISNVLNLMG